MPPSHSSASGCRTITKTFYGRLFSAHPELLDGLFSRANQQNGSQQQALAGSIAGFATHLLNHPETLPEVLLSRIAHKHVSLGITPEQYDVVHTYLFEAIARELADVLTEEIAAAWTEVYWLMAHALIKIEQGLYAGSANDKPWSPWTVIAKEQAGTDAVTFTLEAANSTPSRPPVQGSTSASSSSSPTGCIRSGPTRCPGIPTPSCGSSPPSSTRTGRSPRCCTATSRSATS